MEERINELELRYMHQEKIIQELNQVVSHQELAIELLKREIKLIKDHVLLLAPSAVGDAGQESPPHY